MIMIFLRMVFMVLILAVFSSCSDDEEYAVIESDMNSQTTTDAENDVLNQFLNLPDTALNYDVFLPNHFLANQTAQQDNTPVSNAITNNGATLGRVLFYDKQLSANNTISCASCHIQEKGFSDSNRLSIGFNGGETDRNSMGLVNAKFYRNGRFFWDERAASLEEQVLLPIQDETEMGLTLNELLVKIEDDEYYRILFNQAFGDEAVTVNRISLALSQFVRSMVSFESKYDDGLAATNDPNSIFPNFTSSENLGKNLFFSNRTRCAECHVSNAFVGDQPRNNGLDASITDAGLGGVTGNNNQIGAFKVPSLRNIELTAPYMHDGRFETLEEVVEHYNSGVQNSATLDNRLRQRNGVRRLNLSEEEKQGLVDFLMTLTDNSISNDEKFSNPFKNID